MTIPEHVAWPHRYRMGDRPIITQHAQLAMDAELVTRFGRQHAWLRHHAERGATTMGLAIETDNIAALLMIGLRLYDLIVPTRHRAGAVVFHVISRPVHPEQTDGLHLYAWPDISPADCPALPNRPSVGAHAHLDDSLDTIDLDQLLGGRHEVVISS